MPFTASPPQFTTTSSLGVGQRRREPGGDRRQPHRGGHAHEHAARIDLAFGALYELLDIVLAITNVRHGPTSYRARRALSDSSAVRTSKVNRIMPVATTAITGSRLSLMPSHMRRGSVNSASPADEDAPRPARPRNG